MRKIWILLIAMIGASFATQACMENKVEIWAYQGTVAYYHQDGKIGLINKEKQRITEPIFDEVCPFVDGIAQVRQEGLWGVINAQGTWIVKPVSKPFIQFQEGYGRVEYGGHKYGFVDMQGKQVVAPQWYYDVQVVSEGLFGALNEQGAGYMNMRGEVAIDFVWDRVSQFSEGLAFVEKDGKRGYINKEGQVVIPVKYKVANGFSNGLASVLDPDTNRWVFINSKGEICLAGDWDAAESFGDNGLAAVCVKDKWGYIDLQGKIVIKPQWEKAGRFSEGMASVEKDDKAGFIDEKGRYVIKPKWRIAGTFVDGYASVYNGWEGYINTEGRIVCKTLDDE